MHPVFLHQTAVYQTEKLRQEREGTRPASGPSGPRFRLLVAPLAMLAAAVRNLAPH
jgi:hypothetical protein